MPASPFYSMLFPTNTLDIHKQPDNVSSTLNDFHIFFNQIVLKKRKIPTATNESSERGTNPSMFANETKG